MQRSRETDLNHKYPNAEITERHHCDGHQEVHHHDRHRVGGADILGEGAGVDPRVVAQRSDEEVGDNGDHREQPDQGDKKQSVAIAVQPTVGERVTDVAVSVHRDPGDVEDGTDDTQPHEETTDLNRERERESSVWSQIAV